MKLVFRCLTAALLFLLISWTAASADNREAPPPERIKIQVEDARTRVGIASVRLKISDLTIDEDGRVKGEYQIRIPLLKSRNDDGAINLGFQKDYRTTFRSGGTLKGEGTSTVFKKDPPRIITCEVSPDETTSNSGMILLTIETTDHDIEFKSRYRIVRAE